MKRILFSLLSLFLISFGTTICAQSKFGDVSREELEMQSYPNDTTAAAVFLMKEGEAYFAYDEQSDYFKVEYTFRTKIKILTDEGLEWCNQEIGYTEISRSLKEEIRGLSGTVYNLEGDKITKTKLSKEFIFDEDVNNQYKLKKFTMPGAKVGSVIEFKYTIVSDFFYDLRTFRFQSTIPVINTSYEIIIPEYYTYNTNMQGYEPIQTKTSPENQSILYRYRDGYGNTRTDRMGFSANKILFTGTDIPALKDEPQVWDLDDYISKVTFELQRTQMPYSTIKSYSSTWDNIDTQIFDNSSFGPNLKKSSLFKGEVEKGEITSGNAEKILVLVKEKAKWDDKTSFFPTEPKDALKNGLANSSGMNFLLINALSAAGFDAYPVVLSTRSNGRIPMTHPSISAFNHILTAVKIDTAFYYTDASDKYGAWNVLPEKSMVTHARVIMAKDRAFWVDLSKLSQSKVVMSGNITFADGEAKTEVLGLMSDIGTRDYKISYNSYKDKEAYIENLASKLGGEVVDFEVEGVDSPGRNVRMKYMSKKEMPLGDEYLYINPLIDKVVPEALFKKETRKFPIDLNHLVNYTQIVNIAIPEGYAVEELPKSERLVTDNNDLLLQYRIGVVGDKISLNYTFRINKMLFLPTEYEMIKGFFDKAVSKNSEQIVLKKISE